VSRFAVAALPAGRIVPNVDTSETARSSREVALGAEATWSGPSMGGHMDVRITGAASQLPRAERVVARVGRRVAVWASRLTRFSATSDLARLNARPRERETIIRPTLAAVLEWARRGAAQSGGSVDVTLLAARLAAEDPIESAGSLDVAPQVDRRREPSWSVTPSRRGAVLERAPGTQFDLDGVVKGWIADRAVTLLRPWPGALVDADGDVSLHVTLGVDWFVGIADPLATDGRLLGMLRFVGERPWRESFGIATSGTTVHRWHHPDGRVTHHLIDPRTLRPAESDLIQATVVTRTAREAEVLAKSAVILGSVAGIRLLEESTALAGILVKESGETMTLSGTDAWLV
jgi:thiamine biosynthesis lipoprotein